MNIFQKILTQKLLLQFLKTLFFRGSILGGHNVGDMSLKSENITNKKVSYLENLPIKG